MYSYPIEDAAHIALRTIIDYVSEHPDIKIVRFVLYDTRAYQVHERVLQEVLAE